MPSINISADTLQMMKSPPTIYYENVPVRVYPEILGQHNKVLTFKNRELVQDILDNPGNYPARTVRFATILRELVEGQARNNLATWKTKLTFEKMLSTVYDSPGEMGRLVNDAKKLLAVEEDAQAIIDKRQKDVYEEVSSVVKQFKSFGLSKGMDDNTLLCNAMLFRAVTKKEEWDALSVSHTTEALKANPFWSPAGDMNTSILEIAKIIPKLQDYKSYREKFEK